MRCNREPVGGEELRGQDRERNPRSPAPSLGVCGNGYVLRGFEAWIMKVKAWLAIGVVMLSLRLSAEPLGFFEQKFSSINFEKGKWSRSAQLPCYTYTATENG